MVLIGDFSGFTVVNDTVSNYTDFNLTKRIVPRCTRDPRGRVDTAPIPMNSCDQLHLPSQFTRFVESRCVDLDSSGEWTITCGNQNWQVQNPTESYRRFATTIGHCDRNEVCFDTLSGSARDHTAYCASIPSFKLLAPSEAEGHVRRLTVASEVGLLHPGGGDDIAIVLTKYKKPNQVARAEEIRIIPIGADNRPIHEGRSCVQCSRLTLYGTPINTVHLMVEFTMQNPRDKPTVNGFVWTARPRPSQHPPSVQHRSTLETAC